MTLRAIKTVDDVIDALGGTSATAKLMKLKPQHISNWRAEKRIAARTYRVMERHLQDRNLKASSVLWGITEPPRRRKAKQKS